MTGSPLACAAALASRRRFFGHAAQGLSAALGMTALSASTLAASRPLVRGAGESAPGPHFAPRARRVIYLHMEGGPSHLDLFDHKPGLRAQYDKERDYGGQSQGDTSFELETFRPFAEKLREFGYDESKIREALVGRGARVPVAERLARLASRN